MKLLMTILMGLSLSMLMSCGHLNKHEKDSSGAQCKKYKKCSKRKSEKAKKCTKKKKCHLKKAKTSFSPMKLDTFGNLKTLTKVKWLHFTGRLDSNTVKELKTKDYKVVINLLAPNELKFNEKKSVEKNGMTYINIPLMVNGEIDRASVAKIHDAVKARKGEKTLIHCSSGNRAASWLGAHMYIDHKFSKKDSMEIAKAAGVTKLKMTKKLETFYSQNTNL